MKTQAENHLPEKWIPDILSQVNAACADMTPMLKGFQEADLLARNLEAMNEELAQVRTSLVDVQSLQRLFLGVMDAGENVRRRFGTWQGSDGDGPVRQVLNILEDHLREIDFVFEREGIEKIETTGKRFDPRIQMAVGKEFTDQPEKHLLVASETRPGYRRGETILRNPEVIVYLLQERKEKSS